MTKSYTCIINWEKYSFNSAKLHREVNVVYMGRANLVSISNASLELSNRLFTLTPQSGQKVIFASPTSKDGILLKKRSPIQGVRPATSLPL